MKINKFTKRIVSFITALSLSISSTVMLIPVSSFAEENAGQAIVQNNSSNSNGSNNNENNNENNSSINEPNDEFNAVMAANTSTLNVVADDSIQKGRLQLTPSGNTIDVIGHPDEHYGLKENSIKIYYSDEDLQTKTYENYSVSYNGDEAFISLTGDIPDYTLIVSAEFEQVEYEVDYFTDGIGNVDINTTYVGWVKKGTECYFTLQTDPRYAVESIEINGDEVPLNKINNYEFVMPSEDVYVTITLGMVIYPVVFSYSNGTVIGNGECRFGDTYEFTVIPTSDDYIVKRVTAEYTDSKNNTTDFSEDVENEGNNKYSFIMPPGQVSVTVDCGIAPITADGKKFDSLDSFKDYVNSQRTAKDYTVTLNENLSVSSGFDFADITKANSITFEGSGKYINFEGETVNVPYNMTFKPTITAKTKIDINVAAGKKLTINGGAGTNTSQIPFVNSITGTTTSVLDLDNATFQVINISNFKEVTAYDVRVYGDVSDVAKFSGSMRIENADSSVSIGDVVDNSRFCFRVNENESKVKLPKLTVTNVVASNTTATGTTPRIKIIFSNSSGFSSVPSKTTVAYTNGKDLSKNIVIDNFEGTHLYPIYYADTNAVKGVADEDFPLMLKCGDNGSMPFVSIKDIVDYINGTADKKDYTIVLNENLTVPASFNFNQITKANSITFESKTKFLDEFIIFEGTAVNIPYDVTIDCYVAVENTRGKLDVTVANNATLTVNSMIECFGRITGNANTSKLVTKQFINCTGLSGFKSVEGYIYLNGAMSNIGEFSGKLSVDGEKSTVDITKLGDTTLWLYKNNKGAIPRVTIGSIADESILNVTVLEYSDDEAKLDNGTVVLYTKTNTFADADKIKIINKTAGSDELTAFYYKNTRQIKAEDKTALTLKSSVDGGENWSEIADYPNFELLLEEINGKIYDRNAVIPAYQIKVNKTVDVPANFTLPTAAKASGIEFAGDGTLKFKGNSLNIPYDVTIGCYVAVENTRGKLDVTVANNATLTISRASYCFGRITGNANTSKLVTKQFINCTGLSGFKSVEGYISLDGTMSNIGEFSGDLDVKGENSTVDITKLGSTNLYLYKNSKGAIQRVTIGSIADGASSDVYVYENGILNLESGRTFLYTKDNKFADAGKITIMNNFDEDNQCPTLTASYDANTKSIKAVDTNAVRLEAYGEGPVDNSNDGYYSTLEEAVKYINENGSLEDTFYITVNSSIYAPSFTLPNVNKAYKVKLKCKDDAEINIGSLSTVSAYVNVDLENVHFKTTANTLTFNVQKNLTVIGNCNVNTFRGNSSSKFIYNGNSSDYFDITGFKDVDVALNSVLRVNSTIQTTALTLEDDAGLVISENFKSGSFSSFSSSENTYINFEKVPNGEIRYTGTAAKFNASGLIIKGNVSNGSKILATSVLTDLNNTFSCDITSPIKGYEPSFAQVGGYVCLKAIEVADESNANAA